MTQSFMTIAERLPPLCAEAGEADKSPAVFPAHLILAGAIALTLSVPAHAEDYISDDPYSMFYHETWEAYDKLGQALGGMVFATGGKVFPECAKWLWQYTPPPDVVPPPCVDCNTPPPCIDCGLAPPITPIPEPSTWAMMLVGFAGLWFVARRRLA